jgi:hypothetical protein
MCLVVSLLLGAACAHAQNPPAAAPADSTAADSASAAAPRVYGRLNQSDIAIRLRNDELEIRFVPLDAGLLGLLSEDAATALERLVARYRPAIDSAGRDAGISEPGLALVNFFGQKDGVRFDSQLLNIQVRGRLLRPLAIVPLSPQFGSGQLDARESVMAIFLFQQSLPVWDPFQISYGALTSSDWSDRLPLLQRERQRLHPASP